MARDYAPADLADLFSLRIGNISTSITTAELLDDFSVFGEVGDFYRPTNMDTLSPCPFAFVRYRSKESAEAAMMHYNGCLYGDKKLSIHKANLQDSFFTQDTGYITNEAFDTPILKPPPFDGSLPRTHSQILLEVCYFAQPRIALHRIASHRIAQPRLASHRIASHRIALHRIASHR
jgi:RNA recognition motif-containing protein